MRTIQQEEKTSKLFSYIKEELVELGLQLSKWLEKKHKLNNW